MPDAKAPDQSGWTPTPTQEENDLAAQGQHVMDKEHDGSPTTDFGGDPQAAKKKQVQADQPASGGGYQTRQARPASPPAHTPSHPPPLKSE